LLTTANRNDYFQFVAICQLLFGIKAAWNYPAVALQGNTFTCQTHFFYECSNIGGVVKLARYAVNTDGNHFQSDIRLR